LDWEVESWPDWGDWTFAPPGGTDLTPEAGSVTVEVFVTAPDEQYQEFTGEVKLVNTENSSDYCTIEVSLITPRTYQTLRSLLLQFFERLFDRFLWLEHLIATRPFFSTILNLR
jgi:hypothetical protein